MAEAKNIYQRLLEVQKEAVAPREISGKFGKARSAEQILEAYKPVCRKHGLYLFTDDQMIELNGRNYVTATATVINVDNPEEKHSARASAWENEVEKNKYGAAILDTSQVTGKTSSYAKKYALQNLFAIDDTKDADQDEPTKNKSTYTARPDISLPSLKRDINGELEILLIPAEERKDYIKREFGFDTATMTVVQAQDVLNKLRNT